MAIENRGEHLSSSNNSRRARSLWSARSRPWGRDAGNDPTSVAPGVSDPLQRTVDAALPKRYLAVGHVTIDVIGDGERRPGGTALYSALQAARLGLAATIVTRGEPEVLEHVLAPFASELEVVVQRAQATTTLATAGLGDGRRQRMLAWAGPVELGALPAAEILHLAPVAAELTGSAAGAWEFVGLTPQGFARRRREPDGEIVACRADARLVAMAGRCDALVLSEHERASCVELIERGVAGGATVAITAGEGPTEILTPNGEAWQLPHEPLAAPAEDLGAGDVYAAAFFVWLAAGEDPFAAAGAAHAAAALRMQGVGPAAIATAAGIEARTGAPAPPQG
jgi:sugar/nucleoside kinase (ribokinase family)